MFVHLSRGAAVAAIALVLTTPALGVAPSNDDFESATRIAELPFSESTSTVEATVAPDDPNCAGVGHTIWYVFTPAADVRVSADTFGSSFDTTLSAWTGPRGALSFVACNDDTNGLQSRITFDARAGTTYHLMVSSFAGSAGGSVSLHVNADVVPPTPPPPTDPGTGTYLFFTSDAGDFIGGGQTRLITSATSTVSSSLLNGQFGASFFPFAGGFWFVNIAAPPGQALVPGTYSGALRWPFNDGQPGLSVSGDGRGCNTLTGSFTVNAALASAGGTVSLFDATFEQHCEGSPAALRGHVRIEGPVLDLTPPTLQLPDAITREAQGPAGAVVDYAVTASDDTDPSPTVSCLPPSGVFFPLGTTQVACNAVDRAGNRAFGSFAVTIVDTTPPELTVPADITTEAPTTDGVAVAYEASATDTVDVSPSVACEPASGTTFAVGTTDVTCTATDDSGNATRRSFAVIVLAPLQLSISIDAVGSVNPVTGVATVSGVVACSRDVPVDVAVRLSQLFGRRVLIAGDASIGVACTAPNTTWSAVVAGSNGHFNAGSAAASATASSCQYLCHDAAANAGVLLRGAR